MLLAASLAFAGAIVVSALSFSKGSFAQMMQAGEATYLLRIDSSNPLKGGNVSTKGGTIIHFDEYGVDENTGSGLLELAAYGNIALQTPISGISTVDVWARTDENKDFYLTAGATPNSCEFTWPSYEGHTSLDLQTALQGSCFYFAVHNKTSEPIVIDKIEITYSCEDTEVGLKTLIDSHLCMPLDVTFNGKERNPYEDSPIDPSQIPENRKIIPTIKEGEYPFAPGRYTYGYEVYDVDSKGNARKLLYTRTKNFRILGENLTPIPDNRKVVTFHIPDENGKEKLITKETKDGSFDITSIPQECLQYSWDSPYNFFKYIGDEHYYPVFRVNGISSLKEGDGCYPVHTTFSYLERGFQMPNPQMKAGYQFGGWYTDLGLTKPYDENRLYTGNLTLYAKCIETNLDVRRVYFHQEDGTLASHIGYLFSDDNKMTLPEASDIMDLPRDMDPFYWAIYCGNTYMGLYKQSVTEKGIKGDQIKFSDFTGHAGDIHAYATEVRRISDEIWSYDLIDQDVEGNEVFQHTLMASTYKANQDFIIPGFAVRPRDNHEYHDQADSFPIARTGQFFMTDEKEGAYLMDGGTLKTIASYGYANIEMRKPLPGILRHEAVRKVGRRAFFNRYGLKGTYFPKNAVEFDIEAYANVNFNHILTLPHGLTRIGDRCFIGASDIKYVCLPRSIKSIGPNAFAYGTYNRETRVFENITPRTTPGNEAITFLYEGSEADFNKLDDVTKTEIKNNAYKIVYNYSYGAYYGRG